MTTAKLFMMFQEVNKLCQDAIDEHLNDPEGYTQSECDWNTQFWLGAKKGNETLYKKILEKLQKEEDIESNKVTKIIKEKEKNFGFNY